jgi:hypothetical protein
VPVQALQPDPITGLHHDPRYASWPATSRHLARCMKPQPHALPPLPPPHVSKPNTLLHLRKQCALVSKHPASWPPPSPASPVLLWPRPPSCPPPPRSPPPSPPRACRDGSEVYISYLAQFSGQALPKGQREPAGAAAGSGSTAKKRRRGPSAAELMYGGAAPAPATGGGGGGGGGRQGHWVRGQATPLPRHRPLLSRRLRPARSGA